MKVFVLLEASPWNTYEPLGVYTSEEKAKEARVKHNGHKSIYQIVSCTLDDEPAKSGSWLEKIS